MALLNMCFHVVTRYKTTRPNRRIYKLINFFHKQNNMKSKLLVLISMLCSLFMMQEAKAQSNCPSCAIQGVKYLLNYNVDSCHYEVSVIITSGSTTTLSERIAYFSQVSLRYNTNVAAPTIKRVYYPVGSITNLPKPNGWAFSNEVIAPTPIAPDFNFISFSPDLFANVLSGPYVYKGTRPGGNISQGDTIRLFSLNFPANNCGNDIKLYTNGEDPSSSDPGMGGADFSQGFQIENEVHQVYQENESQNFPPLPIIDTLSVTCSDGIAINLNAIAYKGSNNVSNNCQGAFSYNWTGPNGYIGTTQDVSRPGTNVLNRGFYYVTITDGIGCKLSDSIFVESKPYAGPDIVICAGLRDTLIGTQPTTGTWTSRFNIAYPPSSTNGGLADVNYTNYNLATTSRYEYIYSVGNTSLPGTQICRDTMFVTVNPKANAIIQGPQYSCAFIDNRIKNLSPATGGTWQSNDTTKARVTLGTNQVVSIAPGLVTFTYTNNLTGCKATTGALAISGKPSASIASDTVCLNGTTTLTPNGQGTSRSWQFSIQDTGIIQKGNFVDQNNQGTFFGLRGKGVGTAKIWYRDSTANQPNCISDTLTLTVLPQPTTNLTTPNLCVDNNGLILPIPNVDGTWQSTDEVVATITNTGNIRANAPGQAQFIFTQSSTGCSSPPSTELTVRTPPAIIGLPITNVCAGIDSVATLRTSPITVGKWRSNNPAVAIIDSITGEISTLASGVVDFTFDDGGGCTPPSNTLTVDPQPQLNSDLDSICVGTSTQISAGITVGKWRNLTPAIITYFQPTTVSGFALGNGLMEFTTDGATKCKDTLIIKVSPSPAISLLGQDSLCIGDTTRFVTNTAGVWSSSNSSQAFINNSGLVTGRNGGENIIISFRSNVGGCISTSPIPLTVIPKANLTYEPRFCIGEKFFPEADIPGGVWTSGNSTVASVDEFGEFTTLIDGIAGITYSEPSLGCKTQGGNILVLPKPTLSADKTTICGSDVSVLQSSVAGFWTSGNTSIATVTGNRATPATLPGSVYLRFVTQDTASCTDSLLLTVSPKPTISNLSDAEICVGDTIFISGLPAGGSWLATPDNGVAEIISSGRIIGKNQGQTKFVYTDLSGCKSDQSNNLEVNGPPAINNYAPENRICIGATIQLTAPVTGKWLSLDTTIASVNFNTGLATGLKQGSVFFRFTSDSTGCSSVTVGQLSVTSIDTATLREYSICVGGTTQAFPSLDGAWSVSNSSIASINNRGQIQGLAPGKVSFIYQNSDTKCKSPASDSLTVSPGPAILAPSDTILCIGETATIEPVGGISGKWFSLSPEIASIGETTGTITAKVAGTAQFVFIDDQGCRSAPSKIVEVKPMPTILINGPDGICIGDTTDFESGGEIGTWISTAPAVASITNTGKVTGLTSGEARFIFTSEDGCPSDTSAVVRVGLAPDVSIIGRTQICIGDTANLLPSSGGAWSSSNPEIASVTANGVVTSKAPGYATFTFVEATVGCESSASTDTLTVVSCIDPDVNITYVNVIVPGDVSTNDNITGSVDYGPSGIPTSKPSGSNPIITLQTNGTYTFVTDLPGIYTYNIPVCISPIITSCPTSLLTITVLEPANAVKTPIANTDFGTTKKNIPIVLNTLANDGCAYTTGCSLDPLSVLITITPKRGSAVVGAGGNITYTPTTNLLGKDTLTYRVCVTGEPTNCATALQIITVEDSLAENSTVAADDFITTPENVAVSGNVKTNDTDPQGHIQTVVSQTTTKPAGTLVLNSDGSYTFTPSDLFTGSVSFPYATCDNGTPSVCDSATLYILVVPDLYVNVRVYLEGALVDNGGEMAPDNRPLMRDNLRSSPFAPFVGQNFIPRKDIHKYPHNNGGLVPYDVTSRFPQVGAGLLTKYDSVKTAGVFNVSGQDAIVDWIFIELRSTSNTTVIATRSGLLQRDGDVVDIDGVTRLKFPGLKFDDYYVVVKHRSHLGVMTQNRQTPKELTTLVDFTRATLDTYDKGIYTSASGGANAVAFNYKDLEQKQLLSTPGYRSMWAGDFDGNGNVKFGAPFDDTNELAFEVQNYSTNLQNVLNYDFAINYLATDFDMNSKSKYDNPDDDRNLLFGQIVGYKLNPLFLANFNELIQQLPEYNP
jgi:hypothetical protein